MDELTPLSDSTLPTLPPGIRVPSYDRAGLTPGIVHIGLGNFHRAHQAWYLHRLIEQGLCHDWAIIGAGVRPGDADQRARLLVQNCLTTLIELAPTGISAEITGAMIDFAPVQADNSALIERMADPAIRIVSLTVTEGGYYLDAAGALDTDHPDLCHDAAHPDTPRTAFGAMVAALKRRRDENIGPFTGLSCDNLQGNGRILRQAVVGLARLSDPDLAAWIDTECTFPNSMVDCIVPATGGQELDLARSLGIEDRAPVTHEDFRQWVIEDAFCAGRPDWDRVGATLTDSVLDHEAMKLRVLNAGHQILANLGELLSVETISGCMAHPTIRGLFDKVQREEILPHVGPVPGTTPADYLVLVSRRFSNDAIVDTTRRVAFDGSSRHPGFVLPTIRDALAAGASVEGLALTEALWARMCTGIREDGTIIAPNDPNWSDLQTAATAARDQPEAWLEQRRFYGSLADEHRFADAFAHWLAALGSDGAIATVARYVDGTR